jgi:hypothetical protein
MRKIFSSDVLSLGKNHCFPNGIVSFFPRIYLKLNKKSGLIVLAVIFLSILSCREGQVGNTGTSQHRLFPERSYQELALKGLSIPRQEAVFKDPAGNFQVARRGDRIGKEELEVIEITDERVILRGMEGGVPQTAVISLGGGKGPGGSFRFTRRPPVTPGLRAPSGAGGPPK